MEVAIARLVADVAEYIRFLFACQAIISPLFRLGYAGTAGALLTDRQLLDRNALRRMPCSSAGWLMPDKPAGILAAKAWTRSPS